MFMPQPAGVKRGGARRHRPARRPTAASRRAPLSRPALCATLGSGETEGRHRAVTTDQSVLNRIEKLVAEEERLWSGGRPSDSELKRLKEIEVELDRAWDLLRQRRARREFGQDPDDAHLRPAGIVRTYRDE